MEYTASPGPYRREAPPDRPVGGPAATRDNDSKDGRDNEQNWAGIAPVTQPGGRFALPWVVADAAGNGYVAYNNSGANATIYFVKIVGP